MANTLKFGNGQWATGNGTALAYNDENANFKPLPFDFTRASSGTVVNQSGLIETVGSGIPRIDFLGNTKGALLLEPSRTNSLLQSNQFDTTWGAQNVTLTSGQIGIGGSTDAWLYTVTNPTHNITQNLSSANTNVFSVYAKANSADGIVLRLVGAPNNPYIFYSLLDGTYVGNGGGGGISPSSQPVVNMGNGWYRFQITATGLTQVVIYGGTSLGAFATTGSIYIQNAQVEEGSYATSYIPTSGSAVTRLLENITQTTPNLSNSQEVTAFIDLGARPLTGSNSTSDAIEFYFASNNRIIYNQNGSSKHRIEINTDGNSTRNYFSTTTFSTTPIKIAIAVTQSTLKIYTNRGDSWNVPIQGVADWSNLSIVKTNIVQSIGNIKINDLKFYNTALTDQELIALTQV